MTRSRRALPALLALAVVLLTACTGLPTSGTVQVGNKVGEVESTPDVLLTAQSPAAGATPEEIVQGFMEASVTSTNAWEVARQFLTPELAKTWRPSAGVTIDSSVADRKISSDIAADDEDSTEGRVRVTLDQVARVDDTGTYAELSGDEAQLAFEVARNEDGEWRITQAEDGIVLDAATFPEVYRSYDLQFYDPSFRHLVPDVRWYPQRDSIATTLTQALVSGKPSEWLGAGVRNAFSDVTLAVDSVPVDSAQVAKVELDTSALSLDATTLARMRTQLEETLSGAGVQEVRFFVNDRDLNADKVTLDPVSDDTSALVLTEKAFGKVVGDEVTALGGLSEPLLGISDPITDIDVSGEDSQAFAAVRLGTGQVYAVGGGKVSLLDSRPGLVRPSIDPYGYVWSVPQASPAELTAWQTDVTPHTISGAFANVQKVSAIRVATDGARLAAVVTVGGQQWISVSAIIRDDNQEPTGLGTMSLITRVDDPVEGLVWLGTDTLGVLLDDEGEATLLTQLVGGPGSQSSAAQGAVSLAGSTSTSGARTLDGNGMVSEQRNSTWQETMTGVRVLATRMGQ